MAKHKRIGWGWLAVLVTWAPVWMPLVLFAQIGVLGLRPALAEEQRLERAEIELKQRYERGLERRLELERTLRAQQDPMYQERERRSWTQPAAEAQGAAAPEPAGEARDQAD